MTVSVHNPDQYMARLRQIIAQGRKRIGLRIGAGAPAGIFPPGSDKPLIPAVAGLTDMVVEALSLQAARMGQTRARQSRRQPTALLPRAHGAELRRDGAALCSLSISRFKPPALAGGLNLMIDN